MSGSCANRCAHCAQSADNGRRDDRAQTSDDDDAVARFGRRFLVTVLRATKRDPSISASSCRPPYVLCAGGGLRRGMEQLKTILNRILIGMLLSVFGSFGGRRSDEDVQICAPHWGEKKNNSKIFPVVSDFLWPWLSIVIEVLPNYIRAAALPP